MSFFSELKRRHIIRVAIAYALAGWVLLQGADFALDLIDAPNWVIQALFVVVVLGLPVALAFAWAFELTPDGIKRDHEVDKGESNSRRTGRKLSFLIVVLLVLGLGYHLWESRFYGQIGQPGDGAIPAQAVPDDLSIAVLPFVNMSAEEENEYFADGLSEEILNRLAQVPQLRVIARTSAFAFKGDNRDLREVGSLLGAAHILEGSVRRSGDVVRITAQLITSSDGAHLWSQTYDRQLEDVFEIQDEIAAKVVEALDVVLDEDVRQLMYSVGVRNVDAFIAYQKGTDLMVKAHNEDPITDGLVIANEWLNTAVELAPPFPSALARTADLYAHQVMDGGYTDEEREIARLKAIDILTEASAGTRDPVQRALVNLDRLFFTEDWSAMQGLLEQIFSTDDVVGTADWMELTVPFADPDSLYGYYERRMKYDPMYALSATYLADLLILRGEAARAEALLDEVAANSPSHRWLGLGFVNVYLATGRFDKALAYVDREGNDWSGRRIMVHAAAGRSEEALAIIESYLDEDGEPSQPGLSESAWLGLRDRANERAAELDALPGGPMRLLRLTTGCSCGAPFDLSATPNLEKRLEEAGWAWPPPAVVNFPAKDW